MKIRTIFLLATVSVLLFLPAGCKRDSSGSNSLEKNYSAIPFDVFMDSVNHARYGYVDYQPPYPVYYTTQIAGIAENFLLFQNEDGGWPKNVDWLAKYNAESAEAAREKLAAADRKSTLDNGNIYSQIEYLAKVYRKINDKRYPESVKKAVAWLLKAQNQDSGGFSGADVFAVTYNDNVMAGALRIVRDVSRDDSLYGFLDEGTRKAAGDAYAKGIECILKTQVRIEGVLTAWGQQHDHYSLIPLWARSYEPPALTANESAGVLRLLMEIEKPSPEIVAAVKAGCAWLEKVKIAGIRIVKKPAPPATLNGRYSDYENAAEADPSAPPIWARFYDITTGEPLFYDRNQVRVDDYNRLSRERRVGYSYYGTWPAQLLATDYPAWKKKNRID